MCTIICYTLPLWAVPSASISNNGHWCTYKLYMCVHASHVLNILPAITKTFPKRLTFQCLFHSHTTSGKMKKKTMVEIEMTTTHNKYKWKTGPCIRVCIKPSTIFYSIAFPLNLTDVRVLVCLCACTVNYCVRSIFPLYQVCTRHAHIIFYVSHTLPQKLFNVWIFIESITETLYSYLHRQVWREKTRRGPTWSRKPKSDLVIQ